MILTAPDLSSFYHHALSYDLYVGLAYGGAGAILLLLGSLILRKHARVQRSLRCLEGFPAP